MRENKFILRIHSGIWSQSGCVSNVLNKIAIAFQQFTIVITIIFLISTSNLVSFDREIYAFQGSAFRCLKTGDPIDAVLDRAARESGVPITDILENLPAELAVWVDPGEVSYRIGEKGAVKVYFSVNVAKL